MVQMLFPAHTAALTRNKEDAEALMQIAEIRNKVTGPIILSDIYLTYGGVTTVTIGASAVKAVATACLFNPISCNNAGIFIAEVGAGVSLANPAGAGKAVRAAASKAGQQVANGFGNINKQGANNLASIQASANRTITNNQLIELQSLLNNSIQNLKKLKLTPATAIGAVDPISGKMMGLS